MHSIKHGKQKINMLNNLDRPNIELGTYKYHILVVQQFMNSRKILFGNQFLYILYYVCTHIHK